MNGDMVKANTPCVVPHVWVWLWQSTFYAQLHITSTSTTTVQCLQYLGHLSIQVHEYMKPPLMPMSRCMFGMM